MKYLVGETAEWSNQEHLLADIRDCNLLTTYITQYLLAIKLKPGSFEKLIDGAPKPPLRPGEKPEALVFASKDELLQLFGGGKPPHGRHKSKKG